MHTHCGGEIISQSLKCSFRGEKVAKPDTEWEVVKRRYLIQTH